MTIGVQNPQKPAVAAENAGVDQGSIDSPRHESSKKKTQGRLTRRDADERVLEKAIVTSD